MHFRTQTKHLRFDFGHDQTSENTIHQKRYISIVTVPYGMVLYSFRVSPFEARNARAFPITVYGKLPLVCAAQIYAFACSHAKGFLS